MVLYWSKGSLLLSGIWTPPKHDKNETGCNSSEQMFKSMTADELRAAIDLVIEEFGYSAESIEYQYIFENSQRTNLDMLGKFVEIYEQINDYS